MNKMFNKKGQNALEYTLLIMTVAGAFMAMNVYIRRAVNARLHNVELEVSPPVIIQQNSTTNST